MARDVTAGVTFVRIPPRPNVTAASQVRRVESKPGNYRKGVARSRIDRYPPAAAALAEAHEVAGRDGRIQDAGSVQGERDGAGAIVAAIIKRAVASTPDIRFSAQ